MDFCPLRIGILETGLKLFLDTCSSVTGRAFSSPALILQDRDTKSEVSTRFLKASASSSFITHFTYKCNLSNQFCFQDSHLFPFPLPTLLQNANVGRDSFSQNAYLSIRFICHRCSHPLGQPGGTFPNNIKEKKPLNTNILIWFGQAVVYSRDSKKEAGETKKLSLLKVLPDSY